MGRGGHKIQWEQTCWRQCLILCPKRRQESTGDKWCRAETPPWTFCLEKQQLRSGQVPIKKYNCALMVFTWEASILHHERSGEDCQPYLYFPYSLCFLKNHKFPTFMNLLKHMVFHKNRQIWLQTLKVTKNAWIRTQVTGKAPLTMKSPWMRQRKSLPNALEKIKWPDHYKRSGCTIPSHFNMSCS